MNDKNVNSGLDITKPVILFNFAYDIHMPNSDAPPGRVYNHPSMDGTVHSDGHITYPSMEDIELFLKTNLVARHNLKKFKIDDSNFFILSPITRDYKQCDFNSLPVILPGEPETLINGIKSHVVSRAMR